MESLQALLAAAVQSGSPSERREQDGLPPTKRRLRYTDQVEEPPRERELPNPTPMVMEQREKGHTKKSPFTTQILDDELPGSFRPVMYEYLGTTYPNEHLCRFNNTSDLHRFSEGVKCRVFTTTLAGPAQAWFSQLRPSSIGSFDQLASVFLDHFASSKKQKRSTLTLFTVKQREGEHLRSFVKRFITATLEVPITSEEVLINALAQGLRLGDFFTSISKKPPLSFNELLRKAERYMNAEEAELGKAVDKGVDKRKERKEEKIQRPLVARKEGLGERKVGPRFENYVSLVAPPAEILMAIENHPKLKWPRTYSEVPKKNPVAGSFCRFHNDYGHTTNECQHLRDEIERLIRAKNLPEFVKTGQLSANRAIPHDRAGVNRPENTREKAGERKEQPPTGGFIHMIHGGPSGGDSNRARRAHLRQLRETEELFGEVEAADLASRANLQMLYEMESQLAEVQRVSQVPPIMFGRVDEEGIQQPHTDALVITAMVANFDIARILVDTGSSADVIFYSCFKQMNMNFELKYVETSLMGFSGETVQALGEVCLPISLGMEPVRATRSINFLVLDVPSTYNMILGRPSMNLF
ncbi:PREDICTED: uncharacterized protein LOC105949160 [Erythranthe guttata]|uniref:uncharacterized protein LOC105949160 n=1 Tax=Erythranthe guttata TaxID=4155 RepID=UPI00064DBBF1|nr:PREDICTED: uncharacterized protein LOC105949160 [Erythranthe guttata]|eukprot:XP_012827901.1 PREDICTED: uncharacterized protein LOC105949160 [Erythranthe guttata]